MSEPPNDHCFICGTPLIGIPGALFRLIGISRSHQCPKLCTRCDSHVVEGDIGEISVLFVDLVGFTQMTREIGAERTHEIVNAFLQAASDLLVRHDAFIDKYIGDAAMAIFNTPIRREDHARQAVAAALSIHAEMPVLSRRLGRALSVRIGVAVGRARLGRVGSDHAKDYTAIGDVVNLAARLQENASPGGVLIDAQAYRQIGNRLPGISPRSLTIKGVKEPVTAYEMSGAVDPPRIEISAPARDRYTSFGSVVAAALGAPCAAIYFLGPLAAPLGFISFFSATSALIFLDHPVVRSVLTLFAVLGIGANLYAFWRVCTDRRRLRSEGRVVPLSLSEWTRMLVVLGSAVLSALIIIAEIYAHRRLHGIE